LFIAVYQPYFTSSKIAGRNALQTSSCNDALSDLYLYRSEANTTLTDLSCGNNPELSIMTSFPSCKKHGGTSHKPKGGGGHGSIGGGGSTDIPDDDVPK
jgi:uncharacterized membrane protein YgcG